MFKLCVNILIYIVSVILGQDKGFTVKYNPLPEGVPEGYCVIYPLRRGNIEEFNFSIPLLIMK